MPAVLEDKREARGKDNGKDGSPCPESIECIRRENYPLLHALPVTVAFVWQAV